MFGAACRDASRPSPGLAPVRARLVAAERGSGRVGIALVAARALAGDLCGSTASRRGKGGCWRASRIKASGGCRLLPARALTGTSLRLTLGARRPIAAIGPFGGLKAAYGGRRGSRRAGDVAPRLRCRSRMFPAAPRPIAAGSLCRIAQRPAGPRVIFVGSD
jgi:hypothetical protein